MYKERNRKEPISSQEEHPNTWNVTVRIDKDGIVGL
jgi:hypothetical protein